MLRIFVRYSHSWFRVFYLLPIWGSTSVATDTSTHLSMIERVRVSVSGLATRRHSRLAAYHDESNRFSLRQGGAGTGIGIFD